MDRLGNVVGGAPIRYINVDIDTIRKFTKLQLDRDEPVWFGCDVGKEFNRDLGVMVWAESVSVDDLVEVLTHDSHVSVYRL